MRRCCLRGDRSTLSEYAEYADYLPERMRIPYPHHSEYASDFRTEEPESPLAHDAYRESNPYSGNALLSYSSEQALEHRSSRFTIPFDRQQLADYLAVDRSAMSNELSKMQKDGLITYHKNEFTLNGST